MHQRLDSQLYRATVHANGVFMQRATLTAYGVNDPIAAYQRMSDEVIDLDVDETNARTETAQEANDDDEEMRLVIDEALSLEGNTTGETGENKNVPNDSLLAQETSGLPKIGAAEKEDTVRAVTVPIPSVDEVDWTQVSDASTRFAPVSPITTGVNALQFMPSRTSYTMSSCIVRRKDSAYIYEIVKTPNVLGLADDKPYCAPRLIAKLPIPESFKIQESEPSTSGRNAEFIKGSPTCTSSPKITDNLCDTDFSLSSPFMTGLFDSDYDASNFMSMIGELELSKETENVFGAPNEEYALSESTITASEGIPLPDPVINDVPLDGSAANALAIVVDHDHDYDAVTEVDSDADTMPMPPDTKDVFDIYSLGIYYRPADEVISMSIGRPKPST